MRIVLVLALLCSVAAADVPVLAIKARRPTCAPNGVRWFEVQQLDTGPDALQTTVTLFGNGATQITRTRDLGDVVERGRCLREDEMKTAEALLKKAPWKTTPVKRKGNCKTASTKSTVIKVFDKVVATERECADDVLDAKSRANLAKLKAMLPSAALPAECKDNPLAKGCV